MKGAGIVHTCAAPGCPRWGAYGERVNLRRGKLGTWWCLEHRPPRLRPENAGKKAKPVGERTADSHGQGRLLP